MDKYVITDGIKYMCKDALKKWSGTNNIDKADKFTYKQAENAIKNTFSKADRPNLKIEPYIHKIKVEESEIEKEKEEECEMITIFDNGDFNWVEMGNELQKFFQHLSLYKSKLPALLDNIERTKCDLEHNIEFKEKINACEGYKMARDYHDCRVKRRRYKNDDLRIKIFLESTPEDFNTGRVVNRLLGIEHQKYKPRILNDMFVDKT